MFYLRWPSDERVRAALRPLAEAAVTHPHEGVTRSELFEAPAGFVLDRYGEALGRGDDVFEAACAALAHFGHYPTSFTRVVRLEETFEPGTVFGTVASHFGFASMNPCRITHVIDDADAGRFGFCLGTLPGHAATGEERFLVSTDPRSGEVRYEVQAISRPAVFLAHLGRPAMRRVQARFRAESCASMQRLAKAGRSGDRRRVRRERAMPDAVDYFRIQNLLHLYSEAVDRGAFEEVGELFRHADVYFPGEDAPSVKAGSGDFGAHLAKWTRRFDETGGTPRTRHLCTNLIIEFDDDTHARTRTYFVVFQGTDTLPLQPIITGSYHDRLEKVDGDWRFVERRELVGETGDLSAHLLQSYAGPTGD